MKKVSLFTATAIVSGSMIGSGVYIVAADMGRVLGSPFLLMLAWVLTGLMTVAAALAYGELAAMFPKSGGQYQYLKEAFGEMPAFVYGWAMFSVIQCGTIAAVAVAFAKFFSALFPWFGPDNVLADLGFLKVSAAQLLAIFSVLFLTWLNARGLQTGAWVQNILTTVKTLSLAALVLLGIFIFKNPEVLKFNMDNFFGSATSSVPIGWLAIGSALGVAMVGSLFSSESWENVTFIAGEIENPKRNVPLALVIGTSLAIGLFILANVAYLFVLPFWGTPDAADVAGRGIQHATQDRVGTAAFFAMFGPIGATVMAVMIVISTFGCNNGLVLSGARLYKSMADDGLFFKKMSTLNANGVPAFALWMQFGWTAILCLSGRYGDLLDYVMFVVMIFYMLTVAAVFALRRSRPELERPYKAFGYPVLPALYILLAGLFTVNVLWTKPQFTVPGLAILALGVPIYFWMKKRAEKN